MHRILLIFQAVLFNCTSLTAQTAVATETLAFSRFPQESNLNFEPLFKLKKGTARKLWLVDSTVFIWNMEGASDYFFYWYSLTGKSLSNGYIKGGQRRGEAIGAMSGGMYKNTLWLHDITLNKFVTASLAKSGTGMDTVILKDYPVPVFYYSVQLMDSLTFLGAGAYDSRSKIEEVDLRSGKVTGALGSFDNVPKDIPFNSWKNAYESFLFTRPTGDKSVLACRFADQVEVFDLKTKKSRLIKGPDKYEAALDPIVVSGMDMAQRNENTRFAFLNGMTTQNYIYLLYSGHHEGEHINTGKYIYVYDWEGNPIKKFQVDRYITCFTISNDDKMMYAFDPETKTVIRTKIIL